jgi:hypothetical protein
MTAKIRCGMALMDVGASFTIAFTPNSSIVECYESPRRFAGNLVLNVGFHCQFLMVSTMVLVKVRPNYDVLFWYAETDGSTI